MNNCRIAEKVRKDNTEIEMKAVCKVANWTGFECNGESDIGGAQT